MTTNDACYKHCAPPELAAGETAERSAAALPRQWRNLQKGRVRGVRWMRSFGKRFISHARNPSEHPDLVNQPCKFLKAHIGDGEIIVYRSDLLGDGAKLTTSLLR